MEAGISSLVPLVGRERELDALRVHLAELFAGRGSLVLIGADAGVGKTALVEAIGREATAAGADVAVGYCYDRIETPPYGPWLEGLAQFGAVAPSNTVPTLAPLRPDAASSHEGLYAQVRDILAAHTTTRPLVLILEDLHWADPASLDLLRFLARLLATMPLLILGTYRDDELHRHHPLGALIPLLVREAPLTRLVLHPLDSDATRALVRARYDLPEGEAAQLVAYLTGRTEGNALFLVELLRSLEEDHALQFAGGAWHFDLRADVPVPLLLKQIVDARLARLGDAADALLAIAAVIGHDVPLAVWEAVAQVHREALLAAAERAEEAHLVVASPSGGIRFRHALIRDVLYESIPALRRWRLHRQVAEAIAGSSSADPDAVAYHFQQARDERAAAWLVRAGERAEEAYALPIAASRYEAAFALLDAGQGDAAERGWLRLLAAALRDYAEPEQTLDLIEEAIRLATEADDASLAARARALRGLRRCYRGQFSAGMADLASATETIERLPPGTGTARRREQQIDRIANRGTLVAFLAYVGHLNEARAQGERYLATMPVPATTPGAIGAIADTHTGLSLVYALQGEPALARRSYAAAITAYAAIDHHLLALVNQREELMLRVLPYRADDLEERERLAAAAEQTTLRLIEMGVDSGTNRLAYARLPLLIIEGHWSRARQILEEPDATAFNADWHFRALYLGQIAREQGETERAWRCVREAWPEGPTTALGELFLPYRLEIQLLAATLALDTRDLATARAWLDAHQHWLDFAGVTLGRAEGQALEARWHRIRGHARRARQHAEEALRLANTPRQPLALLAAHRQLGMLHTTTGDAASAERHLAAALALAEACRAPYERALTLLAIAELQATSPDRARATLAEVRAICVPLGAHLALAQADRLSARRDHPPGLAAPSISARSGPERSTAPAGLSAREAEVLRLVAQGLTNAEIGARLTLSSRTVKAHVANIFGKLGVANRAAATRYAVDHDLT